ncbi:hypothetical protein [Haloarchaeobius sp. DFWS5]|uniref:hypothetical protein n=1 Tax=Haloarchaeobius sp. DFWS5 TaxID=3446114 RepID=UPI003EBCDC80
MSDLIGHLLGFRKFIAVVVGLGLTLALLLASVALNETGMALVYLLVSFVVIVVVVGWVYLRIVAKESAEVRDPAPEWERREDR